MEVRIIVLSSDSESKNDKRRSTVQQWTIRRISDIYRDLKVLGAASDLKKVYNSKAAKNNALEAVPFCLPPYHSKSSYESLELSVDCREAGSHEMAELSSNLNGASTSYSTQSANRLGKAEPARCPSKFDGIKLNLRRFSSPAC